MDKASSHDIDAFTNKQHSQLCHQLATRTSDPLLFFFHSVRFFALEDWHVKNSQTYFGVQVITAFLGRWGMRRTWISLPTQNNGS